MTGTPKHKVVNKPSQCKQEIQQIVFKMMTHFNDHTKYSGIWKFNEALNSIQLGKQAYEEFLTKKIPNNDKRVAQFLNSLSAVFCLLEKRYLIKTQILLCSQIDLKEMRGLLVTAFKSKEVTSLFRSVTEKMCLDFQTENFFQIARVFAVLTTVSWNIQEDKEFLCRLGVVYRIDGSDARGSCLNAELQYMDTMFRLSITRMQVENFETEEHLKQDNAFRGLLEELNVPDTYISFPCIIKNFEEAQCLFNEMLPRLQELELALKKPEYKDNLYNMKNMTELFVKYWYGSIYHGLANFQNDPEIQTPLIKKSMEYWNAFKETNFQPDDLKIYTANFPNGNPMVIYTLLLERNSWNYAHLIRYKETAALAINMSDLDVVEAVVRQVNLHRRSATILMIELLRIINGNPACQTKDKVQLYFLIAKNFRMIIIKNENSREQNLNRSIPYMQKYVHAMKTDFSAFRAFGFNCDPEKWIGNSKNPEKDEVLISKLIKQYDENPFFRKFNKYWEKS